MTKYYEFMQSETPNESLNQTTFLTSSVALEDGSQPIIEEEGENNTKNNTNSEGNTP